MPVLAASALAELRVEAVAYIADVAMGRAPENGWARRALSLIDEIQTRREREMALRAERDRQYVRAQEAEARIARLEGALRDLLHAVAFTPRTTSPSPELCAAWSAAEVVLKS